LPRAANDEKLLLEQQVLSDDALDTTSPKQLGNNRQEMDQKQRNDIHSVCRLPELLPTQRLR
jgi:hypothetical protein